MIGYLPWRLSHWRSQSADGWLRWVGLPFFVMGLLLLADAVLRFVRQGRGTPAPYDPPRHLVLAGPYRYVRNPMYLGVLAAILGQGLFLASRPVLIYAAVAALCFHLIVIAYEEPHLRRVFGEEYAAYCRQVRRWLPHLRAAPVLNTETRSG